MDIIPTPKKNVVFDSQILTSLMKCARLTDFQFNHNRRQPGGKSNAFECGSLVHIILEHYYRARINGAKRNDAIDIGFQAGNEYLVPYHSANKYVLDLEHPGLTNTPEENTAKPKRTGWKHVLKTMQQYFDFWRTEPGWTPLFVEHVVKSIIYEDDDIRVLYKGKMDLIEDTPVGLIATDHKTMSQVRDTLSLNNQFLGYCTLLKTRQVQINKIGFQTTLEPHEKFLRPLIPYSMDRLVEWQKEIVPYYAYQLLSFHDAGYYPPNYAQCEDKWGYCQFKNVCERDRNMRSTILEREYELVKEWDIQND